MQVPARFGNGLKSLDPKLPAKKRVPERGSGFRIQGFRI